MNRQDFDLTSRVAIITGAGRGIGKGLALGLSRAGAFVVVAARTASEIETTAAEVNSAGGRALAIRTDVRDSDQVRHMVEQTVREFGRIDVLVNNASAAARMPLLEMTEQVWDATFRSVLKSVFLCSQAAAQVMVQQKSGSIINISSLAGLVPDPGDAHYGSAKAGVIHFTRIAALEWATYNIRVNCIAPGFIETPGTEKWMSRQAGRTQPGIREYIAGKIPLGRTGKPEDILGAALYFASDASSYVTGETLLVSGGLQTPL